MPTSIASTNRAIPSPDGLTAWGDLAAPLDTARAAKSQQERNPRFGSIDGQIIVIPRRGRRPVRPPPRIESLCPGHPPGPRAPRPGSTWPVASLPIPGTVLALGREARGVRVSLALAEGRRIL